MKSRIASFASLIAAALGSLASADVTYTFTSANFAGFSFTRIFPHPPGLSFAVTSPDTAHV